MDFAPRAIDFLSSSPKSNACEWNARAGVDITSQRDQRHGNGPQTATSRSGSPRTARCLVRRSNLPFPRPSKERNSPYAQAS
jgi:hypothetical protein